MKYGRIFLLSIAASVACSLFTGCLGKREIAYVDSSKLVTEGLIFKKVKDSLKVVEDAWMKNAKGLRDSVDSYMKSLQAEGGAKQGKELEAKKAEFNRRQQALSNYVMASKKKSADLETSLMQPAFQRLNAYLQQYCMDNGYKMIFGTVQGGNILAADEKWDITDDVLKSINENLK